MRVDEHQEIFHDTNRFSYPTQRRFHAVWCEWNGRKMLATETTAREIAGAVNPCLLDLSRRQLREQWEAEKQQGTLGWERRVDLAIQDWWAEQWGAPEGVFEVRPPGSDEERERIRDLLLRLPAKAFRGVRPEAIPRHNDARIVAETIAREGAMVTTGNMVKLDHELVNKWTEREGMREGEGGPVIQTADQLIISWSNEHERETLQVGLLAAWPEDPGAPGETVLNEFEKSLGTYDEALLPNTKERMITLLYAEETIGDLIEETRAKLPLWVTQARGKQRRRRQAVRQSEDWGRGW